MERLNFKDFPTIYKDCRESTHQSFVKESYIFHQNGADYLEVYVLDENNIRYIDDNFPGQRRFFNSNIPIRSIDDFESDLIRMRIKLPERI